MISKKFFAIVLLVFPSIAFATAPRDFQGLIMIFIDLISLAIPIIVSLALLAFFWGIAMSVLSAGDVKKIEEGKKMMFWGVIGLFVMLSIGGLIGVFRDTFFR